MIQEVRPAKAKEVQAGVQTRSRLLFKQRIMHLPVSIEFRAAVRAFMSLFRLLMNTDQGKFSEYIPSFSCINILTFRDREHR